MSNLIPPVVVQAIRTMLNTTIDIIGIDAKLYTPINVAHQQLDIYQESPENQYSDPIDTRVFIVRNPTTKQLRQWGLYEEDQASILCWLKNTQGLPQIQRGSYIDVETNHDTDIITHERYELVDEIVKHAHDSVLISCWVIAPYRK